MRAFNYVRASFADGDDYVSDAPEHVALEIERALDELAPLGERADSGLLAAPGVGGILAYVRGAPARRAIAGARFVHALALIGGSEEEARDALSALLERYGDEPGPRIGAFCDRLATLNLAAGARELAAHFVSPEAARPTPRDANRATASVSRPSQGASRASGFPATLGWILATVAAGAAGFFAALALTGGAFGPVMQDGGGFGFSLPAVSAPGPADAGQGVPDPEIESLRSAIAAERAAREETLADLQLEQLGMANRLAALEDPAAADAISDPDLARGTSVAFVNASTLWVRSGPGPEHSGVGRLRSGARVRRTGESTEAWTRIESPLAGWVSSAFLRDEGEDDLR